MNYLRDSGKQFGLLVIGRQRFGFEEAFKSNPLSHLLEVHVNANALFDREKEAVDEAKQCKEDTSQLESRDIFAERNVFFFFCKARSQRA